MSWLAEPLAAAGFLAVAVDHHGNSWMAEYVPQGFAFEWERPRDLSFVLDVLEADGPVGAAGFSSGGFTAAALVGARLDPVALRAVLEGTRGVVDLPEFPGFLDALRTSVPADEVARAFAGAGEDLSDSRVRAAFLVCPANGGLLTDASLAAIDRPVEIRWAGADTMTPPKDNALRYLGGIPTARGHSVGESVEHYFFLSDNAVGEDVRRRVAADAVTFFRATLGTGVAEEAG